MTQIDGVALIRWIAEFAHEMTSECSLAEKWAGREAELLEAFLQGRSPHDEDLIERFPCLEVDE